MCGYASVTARLKCATGPTASHAPAAKRHQVITIGEHHENIPLGNRTTGKTLVHIQQAAPVVEQRPLAAYETLAGGAQ